VRVSSTGSISSTGSSVGSEVSTSSKGFIGSVISSIFSAGLATLSSMLRLIISTPTELAAKPQI
jgi:hypothetical protein